MRVVSKNRFPHEDGFPNQTPSALNSGLNLSVKRRPVYRRRWNPTVCRYRGGRPPLYGETVDGSIQDKDG